MQYRVAVIEQLKHVETVDAESSEEALQIVQEMYEAEQIKLDYRDYDGYNITIQKE